MVNKIILCIFISGVSILSFAQQEPQYTMFWNNYESFNPAYSGIDSDLKASLTYRKQWTGINTWNFNASGKVEKVNSGVGINYTRDFSGFILTNVVNLNYNYQFKIGTNARIGAGASLGLREREFFYYLSSKRSIKKPNINIGLVYQDENYNFGLGVTQVTESRYFINNSLFFQDAKHMFVSASCNFHASSSLIIIPTFLYKTDFVKNYNTSVTDLNVRAVISNVFWIGTSYRYRVSVSGMIGVKIKNHINVGYAYDRFINGAQRFGPTHEITASFELSKQS